MARSKDKTFDQAAAMQDKAVRFLRDVVGDDEKADEIEALSVEEYASRKGLALINPATPSQRSEKHMAQQTKADVEAQLETADAVLDDIWAEIIANDDGETDEADALENIAEILNEFDADRFPIDDPEEEDEAAEQQDEAA